MPLTIAALFLRVVGPDDCSRAWEMFGMNWLPCDSSGKGLYAGLIAQLVLARDVGVDHRECLATYQWPQQRSFDTRDVDALGLGIHCSFLVQAFSDDVR